MDIVEHSLISAILDIQRNLGNFKKLNRGGVNGYRRTQLDQCYIRHSAQFR